MSTEKFVHILSFFKQNAIEIPAGKDADIQVGDIVIYKNEEDSEDAGKVLSFGPSKDAEKICANSCILRKATSHDMQKLEAHDERKEEAMLQCREKVNELQLNMFVFDASYSFDGKRLAFLFTADERVDFRELVKRLATSFKKQIHLHQVGPRDRAKIVGGSGKCGRSICCKSWLTKLASINMEMVRVQNLEGKGGSKLSGVCGKLLCCLRYEVEEYQRMRDGLPLIGTYLLAADGEAEVIGLDILNRKIKVYYREGKFGIISDKDVKKILSVPDSARMEQGSAPEPELV